MLTLVSAIHRDVIKCMKTSPVTPSILKKLTLIKNNAIAILGELEKAKAKSKVKKPLVSQVDTAYTRFPKIYLYGPGSDSEDEFTGDDDDDDHNMALELFSAKQKEIQVGDFICKRDAYRSNGTYLVTRDGKLGDPILLGNANFGIPAWVFELGMAHGHSFDALKKLYCSGDIGASFFVYPKSMQGTHLKMSRPSGEIERVLVWDLAQANEQVISDGDDIFDDIDDAFTDAIVFLQTVAKAAKAVKKTTLPASKSSTGSSATASTSTCVKQTTKKYTDRPSPPFPAVDCPGSVKKGNNGKMYESVANVKGIYTWKLQK